MSLSTRPSAKITIRDIALIGLMTATLEVVKLALSFLPNIELVTLLIMLYTVTFGWRTLCAVFCFILVEMVLYGPGLWWIMYLYIWPLLFFIVLFIHHLHLQKESPNKEPVKDHLALYTLVSGFYGLTFGAVCAIPYLFIGGWTMAFTWWIAGIPYDLLHCVGNVAACLILWKPLRRILLKCKDTGFTSGGK